MKNTKFLPSFKQVVQKFQTLFSLKTKPSQEFSTKEGELSVQANLPKDSWQEFSSQSEFDEVRNSESLASLKQNHKSYDQGLQDGMKGIPEKEGLESFGLVLGRQVSSLKAKAQNISRRIGHRIGLDNSVAESFDIESRTKELIEENKPRFDHANNKLLSEISQNEIKRNNEIDAAEIEELKGAEIVNTKYEGKKPRKKWYDTTPKYILVLLLFAQPELFIHFDSFQNIIQEGSNLFLMNITGIVTLLYMWLAHHLGSAVYHSKKMLVTIYGILSITLLLVMTFIRTAAEMSLWLTVIYLILFVIVVVLAFLRAENREVFASDESVKKHYKKANKFDDLLKTLQVTLSLRISEFKSLCKKVAGLEFEYYNWVLTNSEKITEDTQSEEKILLQEIDQLSEAQKLSYRKGHSFGRNHTSKLRFSKGARTAFGSNAFFLLFGLSILFGACNTTPENAVGVVIDLTDERNIPGFNDQVYSMMNFAGQNESEIYNSGMAMIIGPINDRSMSELIEIEPLEPSFFLFRNEIKRKKEVENFFYSGLSKISGLYQQRQNLDKTYVARNISHVIKALGNTKAKTKRLYIFSDLLSHNPSLDLYAYRDDPSELIDHMDSLQTNLLEGAAIKLDDIDVMVIHQYNRLNDELGVATREFWKNLFLNKCNAKSVAFSASISKQSTSKSLQS